MATRIWSTRANAAMTTRHLVDPDLLPLIDAFAPMELSEATLPVIRNRLAAMAGVAPLPDIAVRTREVSISSGEAGRLIRCLAIQPSVLPRLAPAMLHFHGGGHVIGAPEMNQVQLMQWAAALNCLVLSVDYRLAPECPFPGPMDDAYAALRNALLR